MVIPDRPEGSAQQFGALGLVNGARRVKDSEYVLEFSHFVSGEVGITLNGAERFVFAGVLDDRVVAPGSGLGCGPPRSGSRFTVRCCSSSLGCCSIDERVGRGF